MRKRRATDGAVSAAFYLGMRPLSLLLIQGRARRFGQRHGRVRGEIAVFAALGAFKDKGGVDVRRHGAGAAQAVQSLPDQGAE